MKMMMEWIVIIVDVVHQRVRFFVVVVVVVANVFVPAKILVHDASPFADAIGADDVNDGTSFHHSLI